MLTIHEWLKDDGSTETVALGEDDGVLLLRIGQEPPVSLPILALERVMERYGKPLAEGIPLEGPRLDLGDGRALHRIRHRARYDVIARDFLVWAVPSREPLVELAVAVSGALVHLAKAMGETVGERPPETGP
jgi:hypothetical protein